jgi:Cft2 family RNA processing exonuclease
VTRAAAPGPGTCAAHRAHLSGMQPPDVAGAGAPRAAPLVRREPDGLLVPAAGLWLDARQAPGMVFVSHAHADHCSDATRILCTAATAALHRARRGAREALVLDFDAPTPLGDADVTLLPAGHVLGSAMCVVAGAAGTLAYTGDFKLRANPFSPPVRIPRCDTLVMECTYGEPRYRFPPDAESIARLLAFVEETLRADGTPVVLAYALGKGQEALHHLTSAGFEVAVHGAVARMCALHESLGHAFPGPGRWSPYRRGEVGRRVLLTLPGTRGTTMVRTLRHPRTVLLTGWALHPGAPYMYRDVDLLLPLSDHADFGELLQTVHESGARRVFTVHGTPAFAAHLRARGVDAEHLIAHPNVAREAGAQLGLDLG